MIIIPEGYRGVHKIMNIKHFDYFWWAGLRHLTDYIWAKFRDIWVNLITFPSIHPLAWNIATRGNSVSCQPWQGVIQCPDNHDKG